MKLGKKKALSVRALKVGGKRITFLNSRLDEIKEAITRQDIKDLQKDGAIIIKEVGGQKKKEKKRKKRGPGNIKKKVKKRKQEYVKITKKLRKYVSEMKQQKKLSNEEISDIRNKIRNRIFKNKKHLREYIGSLKK